MTTLEQAEPKATAARRVVAVAPTRRKLTLRARLAVSYGMVIALVLAVVTLAVGVVHQRLGMSRIDADLTRAMRTVAGVVRSEIDERLAERVHRLQLE